MASTTAATHVLQGIPMVRQDARIPDAVATNKWLEKFPCLTPDLGEIVDGLPQFLWLATQQVATAFGNLLWRAS